MKKCFLLFLLLDDPTLKGHHVSSFTCFSIKHQELYDSRTLIGSHKLYQLCIINQLLSFEFTMCKTI